MKLWYSTTSPYVRKVRAVAAHHGLDKRMSLHLVEGNAFNPDSSHNRDNPLGRIPALQTDDGCWLYNSNVIAEYLDSIGSGSPLYPQGEARWPVLNLHALAEGILENTTSLMLPEKMFRPPEQWWLARHQQVAERNRRALAVLADSVQPFDYALNIGTLYAVCTVDFLLFRDNLIGAGSAVQENGLAQWAAAMNARHACLAATLPFQAA